jgi:hypothetical protein
MSNIRVCLRIKPNIEEPDAQLCDLQVKKIDQSFKVVFNVKKNRSEAKVFTFDQVYDHRSSQ